MAGFRFSLLNLARAMKVVALLLFLLPWATVSCSSGRLGEMVDFRMSGAPSEAIARPSGFTLAAGTTCLVQDLPSAGAAPPANPLASPDPFAIAGGLLILVAFGLTFLRRWRLVALAALALAAGAIGYAVLVRLPRVAHDYAVSLISGDALRGARLEPRELVQMLEVTTEPAFWLTLLALALAAALLIADRFRLPA